MHRLDSTGDVALPVGATRMASVGMSATADIRSVMVWRSASSSPLMSSATIATWALWSARIKHLVIRSSSISMARSESGWIGKPTGGVIVAADAPASRVTVWGKVRAGYADRISCLIREWCGISV